MITALTDAEQTLDCFAAHLALLFSLFFSISSPQVFLHYILCFMYETQKTAHKWLLLEGWGGKKASSYQKSTDTLSPINMLEKKARRHFIHFLPWLQKGRKLEQHHWITDLTLWNAFLFFVFIITAQFFFNNDLDKHKHTQGNVNIVCSLGFFLVHTFFP